MNGMGIFACPDLIECRCIPHEMLALVCPRRDPFAIFRCSHTIDVPAHHTTAAQEREAEFLEAFLPVSGEHAVPVSYLVCATLGDERHDDACSKAALFRVMKHQGD